MTLRTVATFVSKNIRVSPSNAIFANLLVSQTGIEPAKNAFTVRPGKPISGSDLLM